MNRLSASSLLDRERENLIDLAWLLALLGVTATVAPGPAPTLALAGLLLAAAAVFSPRRPATSAGAWQRWLDRLGWQGAVGVGGALLLCGWQRLSVGWLAPFAAWPLLSLACRLEWSALATRLQADPRATALAHLSDPLAETLLVALIACWAAAWWSVWPLPFAAPLLAGSWFALRLATRKLGAPGTIRELLLILGLAAILVALGAACLGSTGISPGLLVLVLAAALGLLRRLARADAGPHEALRVALVVVAAACVMRGFATRTVHGAADAQWYATMLHDMVAQVRAGIFPVFLGQTEYQFNGAIYPLRVAPAFHYLGALLDVLTLRSLPAYALQNLLITLIGVGSALLAYLGLAALAGGRRWLAVVLASLFISCPGVAGIAYNSDLFMSWTTLPWVVIAFWATARSYERPDAATFLALGGATGLAWWGHSPIALWISGLLASLQILRVATTAPGRRAWGPMATGGAVFLIIAAYPVGSVLLFPPEPGVNAAGFQLADAKTIARFVTESFPASVLPLSELGRMLGDFQLGYALLALWLGCVTWGWRTASPAARGLLAWGGLFLLLLLPWPFLNSALWRLVPGFVRNTTGNWAMNRLYLPAALCVVTGAALLASRGAFWSSRTAPFKQWLVILLLGATGWSLLEARKFAVGSARSYRDEAWTEALLAPENAVLTRFAYLVYPRLPSHFSHGTMDPQLLHRVLAPDFNSVLADNYAVARAGARPVANVSLLGHSTGEAAYEPSAPLTLKPGQRYLAEISSRLRPDDPAVLHIGGLRMKRTYALPEYGERRSFGQGGEHTNLLPLFTTASGPEAVRFRLQPASGISPAEGALGATVRLLEYDPPQLPVRVELWAPYRSRVEAPAAGWLETPRMYLDGYVATVNEAPAVVKKSADGLVAVAVPAGSSTVRLLWQPPLGLLGMFWVSLSGAAAWLAGVLWLVSRHRLLSSPAP